MINSDDCWLYARWLTPDGYGVITDYPSKNVYAHRAFYELFVGEIPKGYQIDHLCSVRRCINPDHLEAVTKLENIRRSKVGQWIRRNNKCPQGHKYEGDNLFYESKTGFRRCKECKKYQNHKSYLIRHARARAS